MAETSQFQLPLLSASQAQKHVTVNEALALLDCVSQLRVLSTSLTAPPAVSVDGDAYLVPVGATDDWYGLDGRIAVAVNGGWRSIAPKAGWQCFNVESGTHLLFDGTAWLDSTLAATPTGAATSFLISEVDFVITAGTTLTTDPIIPANSQVIGMSARVIDSVTGTLTAWQLGVPGAANRYGSGLGLSESSYALGMSGTPVTYYADTPAELTAEGGDFATGTIRLAAHYMQISPPRIA